MFDIMVAPHRSPTERTLQASDEAWSALKAHLKEVKQSGTLKVIEFHLRNATGSPDARTITVRKDIAGTILRSAGLTP